MENIQKINNFFNIPLLQNVDLILLPSFQYSYTVMLLTYC
jgi:hypothetical protein